MTSQGKILSGIVVRAKAAKTVVVEVSRLIKHQKYQKYYQQSKRYLAHDEAGRCREGDRVRIQETRPLSRRKHFFVLP